MGPGQVIGSAMLIRIGLVKVSRVGIFELFWPDTRVNLRAREVFMPKELLNNPDIRSVFKEMTREGMAHHVWRWLYAHLPGFSQTVKQSPDGPVR